MEANEAKKPKRPRIGQPMGLNDSNPHSTEHNYENQSFTPGENRTPTADGERQGYQQHDRPYRPQGYQPRQGGYQPRQGGYQQRPGGFRPGGYNHGGYQQRQGGYNQNRQQGGYQQRYAQQRPESPETIGETGTTATTTDAAATDAAATPATQHT